MFDIIVVGGGHAGYEAAAIAARLKKRVLLISSNLARLGYMSCNPAVGGLAKGQMVKELDALGGLLGKVADRTGIQFRVLNLGRGPAVRATRSQNDRDCFSREVARLLAEECPGLELLAGEVVGITRARAAVTGVTVRGKGDIAARRVILCCGTFLNGLIHIGMKSFPAGRRGDAPACGLTASLTAAGIQTARLKTGTPPRLDGRTIDFSTMVRQDGDVPAPFFSPETEKTILPQRPCYLTHTNSKTAQVIRDNLDRSPLYSGKIVGIGPRYCPSIEDKIVKFIQHVEHQVFIEPEGVRTDEVYANGIPTSLPEDVQENIVASIPGLENAVITKYGYAIEYDFFPPVQLYHTLESKVVKGLYFAGQINGTSGYEEAAAQGIVAGINAARAIDDGSPVILARDQAYIGVLIDDLVSKGTNEPYRMFTSRAEYRLRLRDDNALFRMHPLGNELGAVTAARCTLVDSLLQQAGAEQQRLKCERVRGERLRQFARKEQLTLREESYTLESLGRRPEIGYAMVYENFPPAKPLVPIVTKYIESEIKYSGYIKREERLNRRRATLERYAIPPSFDYTAVAGIRTEALQKLQQIRPINLAQAARISGVTPADVQVLEVHVKRHMP